MEYVKLGNSDLEVSRICLGCMSFGEPSQLHPWTLDEEASHAIIKRALELGVNFFDTAMGYANGTSEIYLGRTIKSLAERKDVIIATKFVPRTQVEIDQGVNGQVHVARCLEASLERLGMDYVDLYILHMWDYHTPIEEIMEGLNDAVVSGKVRAIGISNAYAWQIAKANAIAEKNGWAQFVSIQGHYNLIFREEELEMIPFARSENMALTPYSALASGRLIKPANATSKRLELDQFAKGKYDASKEADQVIIDRVAEIAHKRDLSRTQVALGWLLTKVTAPIIGATKLHHIEGAVEAVGVKLSQEEIAYLEEAYVPHALVGVMAQNK